MSANYSIEGFALQDLAKNKCGDAYVISNSDDDKFLMFAVADGVGSRPCDWKASDSVCAIWISEVERKLQSQTDIALVLEKSLQEVNRQILLESEPCAGMMSTFVAVIWDKVNDVFYHCHLGDSRLYLLHNQSLQKVTEDHSQIISQKNLVTEGVPVIRSGINNALGQVNPKIKIEKLTLTAGDALILATDGFYTCSPTFTQDIQNVIADTDIKNALDRLMRRYDGTQKDDATVLVFRNNSTENLKEKVYSIILAKENIATSGIFNYIFAQTAFEILLSAIKEHDVVISENTIDYIAKNNLKLGRDLIDKLIKAMRLADFQNGLIYQRLLILMRKT